MMVYVPYADRPYSLNHWPKSFPTFDKFLEYYDKVYTRYDEILGVELNPENPVNQNVKAKWFIKANANGVGAAYYAVDHIG